MKGKRPEKKRLSCEETERIISKFSLEGYYDLGMVLEHEEADALREIMDRMANDPRILTDRENDYIRQTYLMRLFEYDQAFRDLIVREPFAGLAEAILGKNCHCMAQNALFTPPDKEKFAGAPGGWHVDDALYFPLPSHIPRHDASIPLPCFVLRFFLPLTDIEAVEFGPTQVVPRSHFSGRSPEVQDCPHFEDNGPITLLARKGQAYMMNSQLWHRAAPNVSERTRYMAGVTYSRRFIAQRFYPHIDYRMPDHVWEGASKRLQRMLGRHGKGPYG